MTAPTTSPSQPNPKHLVNNAANNAAIALARWSVADYHRMIAAGILQNRRVELLAGNIVEMAPEPPLHYSSASESSHYLASLLQGMAHVRFNGPITLPESEPEPDIAIVRLGCFYLPTEASQRWGYLLAH